MNIQNDYLIIVRGQITIDTQIENVVKKGCILKNSFIFCESSDVICADIHKELKIT